MNYEIREIANYIIAQPKLPYCKVVIHSWLIHSISISISDLGYIGNACI